MIETIRFGSLKWSHIVLPTDDDLKILQDYYQFHPLDIEDCRTMVNLRPKIDIYDDYYFLILHFPGFNPTRTLIDIREIKVFWGKDFLITIAKSHWMVKELFNREKNKSVSDKSLEVGSSDELLYKILEFLLQDTRTIVEEVNRSVDSCGNSLFAKHPFKTIEKLSATRKNVILLNTMFRPQIALFDKLQSGAISGFAENMEDYWGNILDYFQHVLDVVEDDGELIRGYSMTFDSLQVSKTNEVMKILTLISTILLPLTFIASVYGMNIHLPIQDHPQSFLIVSGFMGIIAIGMVIYFRFRRWM